MSATPTLSIIVPCHNERENLEELWLGLQKVFPSNGSIAAEFVFVDDGSDDDSEEVLVRCQERDSRVVIVRLPRRSGQTQALWAGLRKARGTWIAHLDGDLQNDPADLPHMLEQAFSGGYDAVLGFRAHRHDGISRRWASRLANGIRRMVLRDRIRDIGCSTRVVRRRVLESLPPVRNQHRYLPALIEGGKWRCIQVPTRHHDRLRGNSNYGNLGRTLEGLRDLPRMMRYIRRLRRAHPGVPET